MKTILSTVGMLIIFTYAATFFGGLYLGTKYTDNQIGIDSLQRTVDSLRSENFVLEVQLGRYEMTMDWYKDTKPKEAQKLDKWMSDNTE